MDIFLENKYTKWYFEIINNAKIRVVPDCYTEKHHVIPKSLGGGNEETNIVKQSEMTKGIPRSDHEKELTKLGKIIICCKIILNNYSEINDDNISSAKQNKILGKTFPKTETIRKGLGFVPKTIEEIPVLVQTPRNTFSHKRI